jgi:arylsulfatase A-like enzyme
VWPEGPSDYTSDVVPGLSRDSARVLMPSFERVRRDGAVFTQAFTPTPLCAPARFAVLTGRHCSASTIARTRTSALAQQDVVYVNNDACQLTSSTLEGGVSKGHHDVTLAKVLADVGYTTIFSGERTRDPTSVLVLALFLLFLLDFYHLKRAKLTWASP